MAKTALSETELKRLIAAKLNQALEAFIRGGWTDINVSKHYEEGQTGYDKLEEIVHHCEWSADSYQGKQILGAWAMFKTAVKLTQELHTKYPAPIPAHTPVQMLLRFPVTYHGFTSSTAS